MTETGAAGYSVTPSPTDTLTAELLAQTQGLIQQLACDPSNPALHYELGRLYLQQQAPAQAQQAFSQALSLAPGHPQIFMQLGNCASRLGDETQACHYFRLSLQHDPRQADVHYNLGNSLRKLGQTTLAVSHYQQALALTPNDADIHNNLGNAYRELGQLEQACLAYAEALRHNPQLWHAKVHWIHQKQHMADWQGLDAAIDDIRQVLQQGQAQIPPFAFLAMPGTTDAEQVHCASLWAEQHYGHIRPLPPPVARDAQQKIKLAYLSADFRRHPLASLVTEVLASHDRNQFEVSLYSQASPEDSEEQRAFMQAADHWLPIAQVTDAQVATQLRDADIDILIDLTGYTQNSRSGIVAYRPARWHINWLGYPGSMGHVHGRPLFDAIIVDDVVMTAQLAELPLRLPCYQPNNAQRPHGSPGTRADHQLPENAFVFCNFNQSFKITSEMFALWMQILAKVPNSVLWLLECNRWAVANLRRVAKQSGIDPERLIFAPRVALAHHVARQIHADLILDTIPYNAHTTASDALWMGVPILTLLGNTFPARVSASLLKSLQMDRMICYGFEDYFLRAQELAKDRIALINIRKYLREHRHLLFDPQKFCEALETGYVNILSQIK